MCAGHGGENKDCSPVVVLGFIVVAALVNICVFWGRKSEGPKACGIFPKQGLNPWPLLCQTHSLLTNRKVFYSRFYRVVFQIIKVASVSYQMPFLYYLRLSVILFFSLY